MPAAARRGSGLLPALALGGALAALSACGEAPSPTPELPADAPPCAAYEGLDELHAFCMYSEVEPRSLQEAESVCAQAGAWEDACRLAWVSGETRRPTSPYSRAQLVAACAGKDDCSLLVLDDRPESDVLVQLQLCLDHAGSLQLHCQGHAMDRWREAGVDEAELQRVAASPLIDTPKTADWLGRVVQCDGLVEACPAELASTELCQAAVARFVETPEKCGPAAGSKDPGALSRPPAPPGR